MKNLGQTLKKHLETNAISKKMVAETCDISPTHLANIFHKTSLDCELWERLCKACGLDPHVAFDTEETSKNQNEGETVRLLREIIAEKERTIKILMKQVEANSGTKSEQNQ